MAILKLVFLYTFVSLPISQSRFINTNNNGNLIDQTCKQTPNYNLCVTSLHSDPRSSTADIHGLALIMVGVAKAKAVTTLNQINKLLKKSTGKEKQGLSSCVDHYNTIIKVEIPVVFEALDKGDYKFAVEYSTAAANSADFCESDFSGSSPLTDMNKVMHDVAAILAAIVRVLMDSR